MDFLQKWDIRFTETFKQIFGFDIDILFIFLTFFIVVSYVFLLSQYFNNRNQ